MGRSKKEVDLLFSMLEKGDLKDVNSSSLMNHGPSMVEKQTDLIWKPKREAEVAI